jgi:hypothetical protein
LRVKLGIKDESNARDKREGRHQESCVGSREVRYVS